MCTHHWTIANDKIKLNGGVALKATCKLCGTESYFYEILPGQVVYKLSTHKCVVRKSSQVV